jgi:hypothetical protein
MPLAGFVRLVQCCRDNVRAAQQWAAFVLSSLFCGLIVFAFDGFLSVIEGTYEPITQPSLASYTMRGLSQVRDQFCAGLPHLWSMEEKCASCFSGVSHTRFWDLPCGTNSDQPHHNQDRATAGRRTKCAPSKRLASKTVGWPERVPGQPSASPVGASQETQTSPFQESSPQPCARHHPGHSAALKIARRLLCNWQGLGGRRHIDGCGRNAVDRR